ncbi:MULTISPECIES: dienelactone hydrolase family protein [unclassified Brevundimonas]|uniref:dienelactone hydrolase family protein n=1 Tax=unclassified Brevundimonas TaxID=2622653 RepID=UPI000CFE1119|nr:MULTISPECIES: dienelactone hydrolase family protein [unclassified Brevundimonas]PRA26647.1 dienelactone hydrolase [Brevundimonas sp. MYb27]PQZ76330.1 dienelactone hydrolase [Brevundimonas sp. MYb31]PRB12154.1 dienelactone hydrolase [Brevundimonas sp. MYb52]PRB33057.1 dienelactone hydrolase [Brevundimonas sp. MYb46]PRB45957.1 dienelactone hydrolase [Brevundimonas sp. MYb33]
MPLITRPEGLSPDQIAPSRRSLGVATAGGLMFAAYAPAALSQAASPVTTDSTGLIAHTVSFPAPDGFELPAYVARPEGEGPFPVVIVVSEIFGVHEYIRDICRRLAKAGYAAVAPAFFVRKADPAPLSDMSAIMAIVGAAGYDQVMGDVGAALEWIGLQSWARADKVGITGFCWGGKVVWQACARFAVLDAGVAWYGRLAPAATATDEQKTVGRPWPVDLAADLQAPVLGLYGGQDGGIPVASVETMRAALTAAGQSDSEIVVYPDAPHGFHADYRASYREADAKDGWRRLLAFFNTRLK